MNFLLLGPLEVRRSGERVSLGPRRAERCLLGLLLLEPGRAIQTDRLADLLWDGIPPDNSRTIISSHLSRLRSRLDPERDGRHGIQLHGLGDGYAALVNPDSVDITQFRQTVTKAGTHTRPDQRAARLREGLALWRGPLLADVAADRLRDRIGAGLAELRVQAWEFCMSAELEAGEHLRVLPELVALAKEHPQREVLISSLMLALYRSGQQVEALEAYRRLYDQLIEDMGIGPRRELAELHQRILRDDPTLTGPAGGPVRVTAGSERSPVPAQLPNDIATFAGRVKAKRHLNALLPPVTAGSMTVVVISAISGTAGVGKTTLAVHWAHSMATQFPDGQLYVNLRGFDPAGPPMSPAEAVRGFLDALDVSPQRIPATLQAQTGLFRSLLASRRMLVLLDNARDAEQVRPLLPGAPGCLVLVTSRNQLRGLVATAGAKPIVLELLTYHEARDLLGSRLGTQRISEEPHATDEIVALCAGLPLALAIIAARASMEPALSLTELAGQLRSSRGMLEAFVGDDAATNLRAVFSWSYSTLNADTTRLFRLLGLHPGPDITPAAAASLAGISESHARAGLTELAQAHLISEHNSGRYSFHDLLRAYATELARTTDPGHEQRAAILRTQDHYLHTACFADRLLDPHRESMILDPPQPGVKPENLIDISHALAWFAAERPVLLATVGQAARTGFDTHVGQLAWAVTVFLVRQGHRDDETSVQQAALDAARRQSDQPRQTRAHFGLATALTRQGRYDEAENHYAQALLSYGQLGDHLGQANTHLNLSWLCEQQTRHREALGHVQDAHDSYRAAGHRTGQSNALNAIGWCHALLGDYEQTITYCREALNLQQEISYPRGEASTWDSLGYAYHHLGDYQQAITCYERGIALQREIGERFFEADSLVHLGDTYRSARRLDEARRAWQDALDIFDELSHPEADALRIRLQQL